MLKSKIVFVLGAGAGFEINMPLGSKLANRIADKMHIEMDTIGRVVGNGDIPLFQHITDDPKGGNLTEWLAAARRLNAGLPLSKSIDDFLDVHRKDELMVTLGKGAIIRSILEAEKSSKLFVGGRNINDSIDFVSISDTWFVKLMHMLGRSDPDEALDDVAFINFNYDRCLEHFLYYAVRGLYALPSDRAAEIVKSASIIHPYGFIGMTPELGGNIPFGSLGDVRGLIPKIKTYTEASENSAKVSILTILKDAAAIVFLGFGYHKPNMDLLTSDSGFDMKKIYGTAKDISDADTLVVQSRIRQLFHSNDQAHVQNTMHIHSELDCAGLVKNYTLTWPEI